MGATFAFSAREWPLELVAESCEVKPGFPDVRGPDSGLLISRCFAFCFFTVRSSHTSVLGGCAATLTLGVFDRTRFAAMPIATPFLECCRGLAGLPMIRCDIMRFGPHLLSMCIQSVTCLQVAG